MSGVTYGGKLYFFHHQFQLLNKSSSGVWLPGQGQYREILSISNTRDFQARRAKIRDKDGKKYM
ncbi:MAG: hypothetical protein KAJ49_11140 [Arcobacteraceae bacterium]|nr:hypothetical protein [Arcobacteraceae bacterium]